MLNRLDVRLLEIQSGDTGWNVFSLDYKVAGPIGTVLKENIMTRYLMLFNALWRAKRMVSDLQKDLKSTERLLKVKE